MELKEKLVNIIHTENKKDPLTDIQIAKFLGTVRESITNLRKELDIPNSRQRRMPYLKSAISAILLSNKSVSVSELTRELMTQGFNISRRVVEEILADNELKKTIEKERAQGINIEEKDPFYSLIGAQGSLKNAIEQAKSAVLYPPKGLPTLIIGESGVGKSLFSQKIYEYAKQKGIIKENAQFVVFNCADYGDNPQLLLSLLFGYKKGAFTGAEQDTAGLVEKADGGVLFLDEIHRLPPKGQEILFSILDRGKFRRLGDSTVERKVSLFLIGATTENLEENLLLTFRRRIPMVISLPSLEERNLKEKAELIDSIFQQECNRIHSRIFLDKWVVEVLLFEKFSGNIGQLQNKILVLCARAFLKYINNKEKNTDAIVNIDMNELLHIKSEEEIEYQNFDSFEIRKYLKNKMFIPFQVKQDTELFIEQRSVPEDIYIKLEQRYNELKQLYISEEEIQNALWTFLTTSFTDIYFDIEDNTDFSMSELNAFVSEDILKEVKNLMEQIAEQVHTKELNNSVFRYLAIHLEAALKRVKLDHKIININVEKIKTNYTEEFQIAFDFSKRLEKIRNIHIPENEIGFIALYIKTALKEQKKKNRIGLMVVSHGKIASEMVKVVRSLLGTKHIVALDMPLEEKVMDIYNKAVELSKLIDQGKGILILVDIGSLTSIGEIITERTGIPTRTIDRVELAITIEATRYVSMGEESLDEVYFTLMKERMGNQILPEERQDKHNAIITVCMSGEGTAKYISETLKSKYPDILFYPMSALHENLSADIEEIQKDCNIIAAVGTINPKIVGIDFIPYDKDMLQKLEMRLISAHIMNPEKKYEQLIEEDLILFEPDVYFKKDILEWICAQLINKGVVEKEYLHAVLNREKIASTYTKGGIAVPHGNPTAVNRTSFVFVKLKNLIDWDVGNVDFIFMPVFRTGDKEEVKHMLKILSDETFVQAMKQSKTKEELKKIILQKVKMVV